MDGLVHDEASDVDHQGGEVLVSGPDGVAISMTPEAAALTAGRLLEHAAAASGERAIEAKRRLGEERDPLDEEDRIEESSG